MIRLFKLVAENPKTAIAALLVSAVIGVRVWKQLAVDVFPDISVPRVTIQTEAGGLTAEEVEQRVTIPIESVMNGIPGVSTIRSSSSGGLSFVWIDFEWDVDLSRARFDVFERLSRIRETLPEEVHAEITPVVSVTGEIMLVALTTESGATSALELREIAEYDLRTRLLGVPGIGEVAVIGGRLPEFRIAANPRSLAGFGLTLFDIIEAARDSRTFLSAGYLANVGGEEIPLRQIARADTLDAIRATPLPQAEGSSLRLCDVADVQVAGAPRRGSASFNGRDAVVLSIQKAPGGNTPALTAELDKILADFAASVKPLGISAHADAYRQADFIATSIDGGRSVVRDAVIIVIIVLLVTLLELRTILVVLCTMPLSILTGLALFPFFGLGINVMTLGGFAVVAGDIVDAAIIFTEVIRRKLGENAALAEEVRRDRPTVIAEAAASVAPSVIFSTLIVILVFVPLLLLSGLEGRFFRPLALSYICIFAMSLICAGSAVPALARLFRLGKSPKGGSARRSNVSIGIRAMQAIYRPFLAFALRFPKTIILLALCATGAALHVMTGFGSNFLPSFREDSFNVMVSLPPGASLAETERVCEACVPALRSIPGVISVTRRTGRAERDQHAEPVSSSEFVVRVDLNGDTEAVRTAIRDRLGAIPGCAVIVGYPIAHRISAVLSGTEAELAINIYGEDQDVLRATAAKMKRTMESMGEIADVRANREITVRTFRIDYDMAALAEAGITPREAGEQVAAAFNGLEVGEVRNGIRRRSVTVRLAGDENAFSLETVKSLLVSGRNGTRVRLDGIARVIPEEAPNLMLRESGRRKALISCNPASGVDTGRLVETLRERLTPIATDAGCSVSFGGSWQARESAGRRLGMLGAGLVAAIFFILVFALGSARASLLALLNVPLALVGAVAAVAIAHPVLSVSSLVGFITVIGFVLRNGILLINCYRDHLDAGADLPTAIREGTEERMVPIVMTSLTTIIGLVPIILADGKPGGELLAPLAIVQFGGLLGATFLNLIVLPAAARVFGICRSGGQTVHPLAALILCLALGTTGCRSYIAQPIDWEAEATHSATGTVRLASPADAARLALVGNREINTMRIKAAGAATVAQSAGWWNDPELDADIMRIVNPAENPFLGGASLAFTIPLSGALAREKKAAEAYAAAEAAEIRAAERDLSTAAKSAAIRLAALRQRTAALDAHAGDARIVRARKGIDRLHEAGEITATERAAVRRTIHARHHAAMDAEREISEIEHELIRLLGLRPGIELTLAFSLDAPATNAPHAADMRALVRHPKVQAAVARLDGTEAALDAEIRRQYPDIKFGPAYANEEGLDRIGLVAGITLPLWNRNRKGIAEAESARDGTRRDAIDIWRSLVCDAAAAHNTLTVLLEHPPEPPNAQDDADALTDVGELTPLDYLVIREEILDAQLSELDWRRDVALAAAELERFTEGD